MMCTTFDKVDGKDLSQLMCFPAEISHASVHLWIFKVLSLLLHSDCLDGEKKRKLIYNFVYRR